MSIIDLCAMAAEVAAGRKSAVEQLRLASAIARSDAARHVFLRHFESQAQLAAMVADAGRQAGVATLALAGLAISIKDLFDVQGQPTTGGSGAMVDAQDAAQDCPAVARLRAAGAALIGHTNLSEFAFSGVGINPHFGTPTNAATRLLDAEPRVPGGSTSGGAVSVAIGAAWAALGSDTGGSIRIPAALHGLVGFKNTQRLTPLDGAIPLSTTLDTVCAITHSVRDAALVHGLLAARTPDLCARPLSSYRFGVPQTLMLDHLEPAVAQAFERSLLCLRQAGAQVIDVPLTELGEVAAMMAQGGFAAAESWAWHRQRLSQRDAQYDPRVAMRIRRGAAFSAADYIDLQVQRRDWIARMTARVTDLDAMLSPTVPLIAPPLRPLIESDEKFFAANALLLRNPSPINLLDGCALSIPCQQIGEMPVGLMIWGRAMTDDCILSVGLAIENALRKSRSRAA